MKSFIKSLQKLFLIALFYSCLSINVTAQTDPFPYRGLYVNKFLHNSSGGTVVDVATTILGIPAKENELLQFAKDNNFKFLVLYNLRNLWPYNDDPYPLNTAKTYEEVLCDFIVKAKTQYCVEQIGAAGASEDFFDEVYNWNTLLITPPYNFGNSNTFGPVGPPSLQFVQNQYTQADKWSALEAEMVKNMLYAADFNATCSQKIDVLATEYEFWDTTCELDGDEEDCPEEDDNGIACSCDVAQQWTNYLALINHAATVRGSSAYPLLVDTYLGWFDADGTGNDQQQVNDIDAIVDRVYLHSYRANPSQLFGYIDNRLQMFGHSTSTPFTIVRPILSNEHPADETNNFLGNYLDAANTPQNTIYAAEKKLFDDAFLPVNAIYLLDNVMTYGAAQWFTYTYFSHETSNWNYPYCTNNEVFYVSGAPDFCPAITQVSACVGVLVTFIYNSNYEAGVTCDWDFGDGSALIMGASTVSQNHTFAEVGTYTVICTLHFPNSTINGSSCDYSYSREIIIGGAEITANGPTTFCDGDNVTLTANSGGINTYDWLLPNGTHLFTQAINATEDGDYQVTITGLPNCSPSTQTIHITVNPLPGSTITASGAITFCQGDNVTLTSTAASFYQWYEGITAIPGATDNFYDVSTTGNYSCLVTDANECEGTSNSISVLVNPLPTPTITPSGVTTFCQGNNVTLTSSAATSYQWYEGITAIPAATDNFYIATSSGNYYCIVIDGNGCEGISNSIAVTVNPLPVVNIINNSSSPSCFGAQLCADPSSFSSYSWNPTNETSSCITAELAIFYTVTVIDANGCIGTSLQYDFTGMDPGCCGNALAEYTDGSISPTPGIDYNINGDINITGNPITFSANEMFIKENATIYIEPGAKLIITDASHLHACSRMWNGIVLVNNSSQLVVEDNSEIEDAENAIFANAGGNIQINDAIFDHNFVSVYLANANYSSSQIVGSTFKCTGGYTLLPPHSGERSLHQIHLLGADMTIGDPSAVNDVSGSDQGILCEKKFAIGQNVYNCNLHDFDNNPNNGNYGYSLMAVGTIVHIGDAGPGQANNFLNNFTGVLIAGCTEAHVDYNTFDNNGAGILEFFNFGASLDIHFNVMTNVGQGITMIWNPKSNIRITENLINNINTNPHLGAGISVAESDFFGSSNGTDMWHNVIHSEGAYGIYVNNLSHSKIRENHVYMDHTNLSLGDIAIGIRIDYSDDNLLSCNEVENGNGSANYKFAISTLDYFKQTMECNTTRETQYGIQFIGTSTGSFIEGNEMYNHTEDGFVMGDIISAVPTTLDPLTLYPGNFLPGNKWFTNTWDTHNYYQSAVPLLYTKNGTGFPDYPSNNTSIGGFPFNPQTQSTYNLYSCPACNIPVSGPGNGGQGEFSINLAEQIATSQIPSISQDPITEWKAKSVLYQSLRQDSSQLDSSGVLEDFYSTTSNENIGKITDIKQYLKASQDSAVQNDSATKALLIANAKAINDNINPDVLPELNEKIVNNVYFNTIPLGQYHFNQSYVSDLMAVASQCIYEGGPAVLKARNLIHTQYPFVLFNDNELCTYSSYREAATDKSQPISNYSGIFAFPNPASDQITLMFNTSDTEQQLHILDITGRIVMSLRVNANTFSSKIDLTRLSPGSYIFLIKATNSSPQKIKFNVVR